MMATGASALGLLKYRNVAANVNNEILTARKKEGPYDRAWAMRGFASTTPRLMAHRVRPASAMFNSRQTISSQPYLFVPTSHI